MLVMQYFKRGEISLESKSKEHSILTLFKSFFFFFLHNMLSELTRLWKICLCVICIF